MRGAQPASEPEPNDKVATGPDWTDFDHDRGLSMTGSYLLRARLALFPPRGSTAISADVMSS
jgi:hypothetical protein